MNKYHNFDDLSHNPGIGDETTTGELARGIAERYLPNVRLFGQGELMTNIVQLLDSKSLVPIAHSFFINSGD